MGMATSFDHSEPIPTRPSPVMTVMNPYISGIAESVAAVWAGDIRVGRISYRRLTSTEVRRLGGREKTYTVSDFYYVGTLIMDTENGFDVQDGEAESAPVCIAKSIDRVRATLEDIAERIEL